MYHSKLTDISFSVGPRKLAKTLALAYNRWVKDEEPRPTPPLPASSPPAVNPNTTPSHSSPPEPDPPAGQESSDADNHAPRMLLVEDNHINLKILIAYMKKLQIRYDKAINGKEAVEKYTQSPRDFACILSDISMPVMNGFEAARLIRAFESKEGIKKGVPMFAVSGLATEEAQKEARGSGFDLFLAKPVKLQVLGDLLREKGILESVKT